MRHIDSVPEATPAFVRSTAFIAAMLIGDMTRPMPTPISMNAATQVAVARVDLDARLPEQRDRDEHQAADDQRARADPVGQPPGDRARRR